MDILGLPATALRSIAPLVTGHQRHRSNVDASAPSDCARDPAGATYARLTGAAACDESK